MTTKRLALLAALLAIPSTSALAQAGGQSDAPAAQAAPVPGWIERSNGYTLELLRAQARFFPEDAAQSGLEEYDGLVRDMGPDLADRYIAALEEQRARLQTALGRESDPNLRQDLEILIAAIDRDIEGTRLSLFLRVLPFHQKKLRRARSTIPSLRGESAAAAVRSLRPAPCLRRPERHIKNPPDL